MKRCINTLAAAVAVFAGAAVHAESYFDPTYGIEWSYSVNSDNNTATIDGAYRSTTTDPYYGNPMYYSDWDGTIPSEFTTETATYTVTAIADNASISSDLLQSYYGMSTLSTISLPDTLKYIGDYAFSSFSTYGVWPCSLPEDLEYLGSYAFDFSNYGGEYLDENYDIIVMDGWVVRQQLAVNNRSVDLSSAKGIAGGVFSGCETLKSVTLPNNIKHIAPETFYGCSQLTGVVIPSSVETIRAGAFSGLTTVKKITFAGDKPQFVFSEAFNGINANCKFCVTPNTAGWDDVTIPGTWEGHPIEYTSDPNEHTITWLDDDGSSLGTTVCQHFTMPTHADPTKASTAQYNYTFAGWSPAVQRAESNTTYTATYTAELRKYNIQWWKPSDTGAAQGTRLATTSVAYGTIPSYTGATPTKPATTLYTYEFSGWAPEPVAVTGEAIYMANFSSVPRYAGAGVDGDPYVVTDRASLENLFSLGGALFVKLSQGLSIEGPITVPAAVTALSVDMNGGTIYGATGEPAIVLAGETAFSAKGTGTISADSGIEAVKRPGTVSAASGVTITGLGGAAPGPAVFGDGGKAFTAEFAKGEGNVWTVSTFAELESGSADGLADGQIKVYSADSVEGLESALPMSSGVSVRSKTPAVKVELEVAAPSGADAQFFKVTFD